MSADTIDTGDHVKHTPSAEEWLVAFVRDDRLWWCGWPEGFAALADCVLLKKAEADDRAALLRNLANLNRNDPRHRYAVQRLNDEEKASRAGITE